ncbi:hypothetical protein [Roseococcus pinisoli]|uniref:Uncharacterized protein n=1 Tax=Roseococcus pinisoli TaxID=2835040 RepID=A0ABS5QBY7_9PROT|nr:hypothetical protein [Roseococcus pinisoli]MBS7811216.1 hypothetical protein [Roseococcus pinisoli]
MVQQPAALIGAPKTFAASSSSGATWNTLPPARQSDASIYEQLIVTNLGNVDVFLAFGSSGTGTVTATGADRGYPLLARTSQTFTAGGASRVAIVTASGDADVNFQRASGS